MALKYKEARARWKVWFLERKETGASLREIGKRDGVGHTAVSKGIKRYHQLVNIYGEKWND